MQNQRAMRQIEGADVMCDAADTEEVAGDGVVERDERLNDELQPQRISTAAVA